MAAGGLTSVLALCAISACVVCNQRMSEGMLKSSSNSGGDVA